MSKKKLIGGQFTEEEIEEIDQRVSALGLSTRSDYLKHAIRVEMGLPATLPEVPLPTTTPKPVERSESVPLAGPKQPFRDSLKLATWVFLAAPALWAICLIDYAKVARKYVPLRASEEVTSETCQKAFSQSLSCVKAIVVGRWRAFRAWVKSFKESPSTGGAK